MSSTMMMERTGMGMPGMGVAGMGVPTMGGPTTHAGVGRLRHGAALHA